MKSDTRRTGILPGTVAAEHKPNAKHRHVFAVIRLDDFHSAEAPLEDRFSVTEVFFTDEAAEQEASRLNALNSGKDCRYVVRITRLDER